MPMPELKPILDQIASLTTQLQQMADGAAAATPAVAQELATDAQGTARINGTEEEPKKPPVPGVEKSDDGVTADDSAAARAAGGQTTVTETSLDEVKAAIVAKAAEQLAARVHKSEPDQRVSHLTQAVQQLTTVCKGLATMQQENKVAVENILDGLGATKQIEELVKVEKSQKSNQPPRNWQSAMTALANTMDYVVKSQQAGGAVMPQQISPQPAQQAPRQIMGAPPELPGADSYINYSNPVEVRKHEVKKDMSSLLGSMGDLINTGYRADKVSGGISGGRV